MDRYTLQINTTTGQCTLTKNGAHMLIGKFENVEKFLKPGWTLCVELEGADTYYRRDGK